MGLNVLEKIGFMVLEKMIFDDIDWEQIWREVSKYGPQGKKWASDESQWVKRWDAIAEKFNERNVPAGSYENNCYIKNMISRIGVDEKSTILDIGAGPGTLSIPLAKRAKHVTAIDMSENMIKILKKNMAKENLTNITTIHKRWEDVEVGKDIGKYDIVIASRSLGGSNLKSSLLKIIDATIERAYISSLAKGNAFDEAVYEAVGKRYEFTPAHIFVYNLLYQLGVHAEISLFTCKGGIIHKDFDEAYSYYKWHMQNLSKKEEERLRGTLLHIFENKNGGSNLPESKWDWAVISWLKDDQ